MKNFNTAVYKILKNIPNDFDYFTPIITKLFIDNYEKIIKIIDDNLHYDSKIVDCNIYQMKNKLEYINLKKLIEELYNFILDNSN